jgi:hypothetical protein
MEFIGVKGAKLSDAALKAITARKIREAEIVIEKLNAGYKLNPSARIEEAEFYRNLMLAIQTGSMKAKSIIKAVAALPVTVGALPVLNSELGVHLGILETHQLFEVTDEDGKATTEAYRIIKCRKSTNSEWRNYYDVLEELEGQEPAENGYTVNYNGAAIVHCPGYATVSAEGKAVDHHECGIEFFASEGWHAWRCPLCKQAHADLRGTKKNRGATERSTTTLANKFRAGTIRRIR